MRTTTIDSDWGVMRGSLGVTIGGAICSAVLCVPTAALGDDPTPATPDRPTNREQLEGEFLELTNDLRADLGLPTLTPDPALVTEAREWSDTLADDEDVRHSGLAPTPASTWSWAAENVGRGETVAEIHAALVASPEHYDVLTDPRWDRLGVGVTVDDDGTIYVAEEFIALRTDKQAVDRVTMASAVTASEARVSPRLAEVLDRLRLLDGS